MTHDYVRQVKHSSRSPDDLQAFVASHYTDVLIEPLNQRQFASEVQIYFVGPVCIWVNEFAGGALIYPQRPPGVLVLHIPLAGTIELTVEKKLHLASPEQAYVADARHTEIVRHAPMGRNIGIGLPVDLLTERISANLGIGMVRRLLFEPYFDINSAFSRTLSAVAGAIQAGMAGDAPLRAAPLAAFNLSECLIELACANLRHNYSENAGTSISPAAPRYVKAAIDYIRHNLSQPLSVAAIAETVGVSVRSLQQGFKDFKGLTVTAHIRLMRLHSVQAALSDPAESRSIAEIARSWGFSHLGRFSADYRTVFGEFPSHLKRSSGRKY